MPHFNMQIKTKAEMYSLYEKHAFGNKLKTFSLRDAIRLAAPGQTFSMRYMGSGALQGGWVAYNVPSGNLLSTASFWVSKGADPNLIQVNESAPDEHLIIQGELRRAENGLHLFYDTAPVKMRVAMAQAKHEQGLTAMLLLRLTLWPNSLCDLMEILDKWPDATVEFSAYDREVGDCTGRNMIVWEVRNY